MVTTNDATGNRNLSGLSLTHTTVGETTNDWTELKDYRNPRWSPLPRRVLRKIGNQMFPVTLVSRNSRTPELECVRMGRSRSKTPV
jgi:hypothetical protein